jgi:hypothetical protein
LNDDARGAVRRRLEGASEIRLEVVDGIVGRHPRRGNVSGDEQEEHREHSKQRPPKQRTIQSPPPDIGMVAATMGLFLTDSGR